MHFLQGSETQRLDKSSGKQHKSDEIVVFGVFLWLSVVLLESLRFRPMRFLEEGERTDTNVDDILAKWSLSVFRQRKIGFQCLCEKRESCL